MYQVTMQNAINANANNTSSSHEVQFPLMANANMKLTVVSTGNGTTATAKLLMSDDNVNFNYVQDSGSDYVLALSSASTFSGLLPSMMSKYIKVEYNKGDNTTGLISSTLTFS